MNEANAAEYQRCYALAKKALTYIGTFKTPPTPTVYSVWYAYAEGANRELNDRLDHFMNVVEQVDHELMKSLKDQHLYDSTQEDLTLSVGDKLSLEINELVALLDGQIDANTDFGNTLSCANTVFQEEQPTSPEVYASINALLEQNDRMQTQLRMLNERMHDSQSELSELRNALMKSREHSLTDEVTEIGNRRYFNRCLKEACENRDSSKGRSFLFLADLDNFKQVNDNYGHALGDAALRYFAKLLMNLTEDAQLARYGGDEFAVIAQLESVAEAKKLAEKICKEFSSVQLHSQAASLKLAKISVSLGVATLREKDTEDTWFDRADKLLYEAKNAGRSRAMVERELVANLQ